MTNTYVAFTKFLVARPNRERGGYDLCDPDTGVIAAWIVEYPSHWTIGHMLRFHVGLVRRSDEDNKPASAPEPPSAPAEPHPVDRSQQVLTDGSPVTPDHREIDPATGQQKGYIVLTAAERAKGVVRPVRRSYRHKTCGTVTTMGQALAETFARDPGFYSGTMCCQCRTHFPLEEFVWDGTNEIVGS